MLISRQGGRKHVIALFEFKFTVEALPVNEAISYALHAGDDYELLFTVSEEQRGNLDIAFANYNIKATCIGQLTGAHDEGR